MYRLFKTKYKYHLLLVVFVLVVVDCKQEGGKTNTLVTRF